MMSNEELYLREKVAFLQEMIKKHSYNDSLCAKFREELRPLQAQLDGKVQAYKEKRDSLAAIMQQAKEALANLNIKVQK